MINSQIHYQIQEHFNKYPQNNFKAILLKTNASDILNEESFVQILSNASEDQCLEDAKELHKKYNIDYFKEGNGSGNLYLISYKPSHVPSNLNKHYF